MPGAEPRLTVFRTWHATAITAFVLAVLAFILAQWPPLRRVSFDDLETVSAVKIFLIAGALPRFLQWGSLAVLFGSLTRRAAYLDRSTTLVVVLFPLAVGASWWIGISATHWGHDPFEALFNSLSLSR